MPEILIAKCFYCDWSVAHEYEVLQEDTTEHLTVCKGPILIVDCEGICLPFPKTVLPIVVRREITFHSIGIRY